MVSLMVACCQLGLPPRLMQKALAAPHKTVDSTQAESPEAAVPVEAPAASGVAPETALPETHAQGKVPDVSLPTETPPPYNPVNFDDLDRAAAKMANPPAGTDSANAGTDKVTNKSPDNSLGKESDTGLSTAGPSGQGIGQSLGPITLSETKPTPIVHEIARTLQLNPIYLSRPIEMTSFSALRHETQIDQEITLHDAITYVLDQGMQIKISRESMNYQRWLTLAGYAGFLPSYSIQYNLSSANVLNQSTTSLAKTFLTGFSFPVFQGGGVLYSLLGQRYREKAWREAYRATVSDVYLDVYQKYNNLVLQRVLLQTLAKAVEGDEQQLKIAIAIMMHGTGTRYNVMQVEALLSQDKQSFLQQSVTMRQAALALSLALNYPLSINLVPTERTLEEAPLFDSNVKLKGLLQDAFRFNPGLRQYEDFRLSAARNVQAQSASLYPTVGFFVLYQTNDASVNPAGNGAALGGAATSAIDNFLDTSFAGRVSNNALGQQYSFSPTAGSTSSQGANTGPSAMPAASGGTPIAQVQSGSLVSSGAVAPSIFGGGNGASSGPNANGSFQAPAGIFPGHFREIQAGFTMSWSLPNLGQTSTATILASKVLARQALMQCNQELSLVAQNIRNDYLSILSARESIDTAAATTNSTRQALRYAQARLEYGVSTQLDWIRAQHDYIAALTTQAQAIVASNSAQAQLLHDMGMISANTLTQGYKPGAFIPDKPTGLRRGFKP
jgi:outer membrane protein TolC